MDDVAPAARACVIIWRRLPLASTPPSRSGLLATGKANNRLGIGLGYGVAAAAGSGKGFDDFEIIPTVTAMVSDDRDSAEHPGPPRR